MNEFSLVEKAVASGRLPRRVLETAKRRVEKLRLYINEVEAASGVKYPEWYVRPELLLMTGGELQEQAILFSRFVPLSDGESLKLYVEFTLPLIIYGVKDTLTAVVAHELLHYLNFLAKVKDMRVSSSEIGTSVFEAGYLDEEELLSPERVFTQKGSKKITRLLSEKFSGGLNDEKLVERALTGWIKKGLPVVAISPEDNVIKVSIISMLNFVPDESVRRVLNWS